MDAPFVSDGHDKKIQLLEFDGFSSVRMDLSFVTDYKGFRRSALENHCVCWLNYFNQRRLVGAT